MPSLFPARIWRLSSSTINPLYAKLDALSALASPSGAKLCAEGEDL
jgi:hypothetical protein